MHYFSLLLVFISLAWVLQAVSLARSSWRLTWKTGFNFIASAALVMGLLGFFTLWFSATGALNWLPDTFEWPVLKADNVLVNADGTYIVPHTPSGRVQIYNRQLEFQRGWYVDAGGGAFKLLPKNEAVFYIYTARGNFRYAYNVHGDKLSAETCQPNEYSQLQDAGISLKIPAPAYLILFSSSFAAWFLGVSGLVLLILVNKGSEIFKES